MLTINHSPTDYDRDHLAYPGHRADSCHHNPSQAVAYPNLHPRISVIVAHHPHSEAKVVEMWKKYI